MYQRSLSQTEAKVILSMEAEGKEQVSLSEIRKRAGVSGGFARLLAHRLIRKGWLQRLRRGIYLLNPSRHGPDALPDTDPLRIGSRLVSPYYFGFATAAELEGLLPQASRVYYLVTTARPNAIGNRAFQFRFVRVTGSRFFGSRKMRRRGQELMVSDLERTVLDCLTRPEMSGGMAGVAHIIALAKPRLSWSRLGSHLHRVGNRSLELRTGFLMEQVRPSLPPPAAWLRKFQAKVDDQYVPLGPPKAHGRRGPRDRRWHVIQNVPRALLFAEGEIR